MNIFLVRPPRELGRSCVYCLIELMPDLSRTIKRPVLDAVLSKTANMEPEKIVRPIVRPDASFRIGRRPFARRWFEARW